MASDEHVTWSPAPFLGAWVAVLGVSIILRVPWETASLCEEGSPPEGQIKSGGQWGTWPAATKKHKVK